MAIGTFTNPTLLHSHMSNYVNWIFEWEKKIITNHVMFIFSPSHMPRVGYIASRQSSSHPGCVILLEVLSLGDSFDMVIP